METIHEVILSYATLNGNDRIVGYPQMREAARLSWYSLFKKTEESIIRVWVNVQNGKAEIPEGMDSLKGVYIEDSCGEMSPLFEDNFKNTLPKPELKCGCATCDMDECMCPTLQEIPIIKEVIYNGIPYLNKTYRKILNNGEVVTYKEEWVPSYDETGLMTSVEPVKTQITTCSVDMKDCGCVEASESNAALLLGCGCLVDRCVPYLRKRYPALYNQYGYYKYDKQQHSLHIFDNRGEVSELCQVMLVYQGTGVHMRVPEYARAALIALLDWTVKQYNPRFIPQDKEDARRYYARQKNEMLRHIHPIPFELVTRTSDARTYSENNRGIL